MFEPVRFVFDLPDGEYSDEYNGIVCDEVYLYYIENGMCGRASQKFVTWRGDDFCSEHFDIILKMLEKYEGLIKEARPRVGGRP